MNQGGAPMEVFNIIEDKEGKARWVKIGAAFVNRDGSINALLDVFPRDGKIQIRERKKFGKSPDGEKDN